MLSMLGSIKVLIGKDDLQDYRGAGVKRTMVTAIECISADGRLLLPLIIWPALTYRSTTRPIMLVTPVTTEALMSLYNLTK
jgi:hypothetical protein